MRALVCAGIVIGAIAAAFVLVPRHERLAWTEVAERSAEREGIYVAYSGPGRRCGTYVSLLNPSRENIARLERRYDVCVDRRPGDEPEACTGSLARGPLPRGRVTVPSLVGLDLAAMGGRLDAAGLRLLNPCRIPLVADPGSLNAKLRVVAQCPSAGQRVRRGAYIGLVAKAELSGGFPYRAEFGDYVARFRRGEGYPLQRR